jgi:hypothetical protein
MTGQVVFAIYYQALRLWMKKCPYYAEGIFLCPSAAVKSSWKSRSTPDISNRLRHIHTPESKSQSPSRRGSRGQSEPGQTFNGPVLLVLIQAATERTRSFARRNPHNLAYGL